MVLKHKICLKLSGFWIYAARYYRINYGKAAASDLLIMLRMSGIPCRPSTAELRVLFTSIYGRRTDHFFRLLTHARGQEKLKFRPIKGVLEVKNAKLSGAAHKSRLQQKNPVLRAI